MRRSKARKDRLLQSKLENNFQENEVMLTKEERSDSNEEEEKKEPEEDELISAVEEEKVPIDRDTSIQGTDNRPPSQSQIAGTAQSQRDGWYGEIEVQVQQLQITRSSKYGPLPRDMKVVLSFVHLPVENPSNESKTPMPEFYAMTELSKAFKKQTWLPRGEEHFTTEWRKPTRGEKLTTTTIELESVIKPVELGTNANNNTKRQEELMANFGLVIGLVNKDDLSDAGSQPFSVVLPIAWKRLVFPATNRKKGFKQSNSSTIKLDLTALEDLNQFPLFRIPKNNWKNDEIQPSPSSEYIFCPQISQRDDLNYFDFSETQIQPLTTDKDVLRFLSLRQATLQLSIKWQKKSETVSGDLQEHSQPLTAQQQHADFRPMSPLPANDGTKVLEGDENKNNLADDSHVLSTTNGDPKETSETSNGISHAEPSGGEVKNESSASDPNVEFVRNHSLGGTNASDDIPKQEYAAQPKKKPAETDRNKSRIPFFRKGKKSSNNGAESKIKKSFQSVHDKDAYAEGSTVRSQNGSNNTDKEFKSLDGSTSSHVGERVTIQSSNPGDTQLAASEGTSLLTNTEKFSTTTLSAKSPSRPSGSRMLSRLFRRSTRKLHDAETNAAEGDEEDLLLKPTVEPPIPVPNEHILDGAANETQDTSIDSIGNSLDGAAYETKNTSIDSIGADTSLLVNLNSSGDPEKDIEENLYSPSMVDIGESENLEEAERGGTDTGDISDTRVNCDIHSTAVDGTMKAEEDKEGDDVEVVVSQIGRLLRRNRPRRSESCKYLSSETNRSSERGRSRSKSRNRESTAERKRSKSPYPENPGFFQIFARNNPPTNEQQEDDGGSTAETSPSDFNDVRHDENDSILGVEVQEGDNYEGSKHEKVLVKQMSWNEGRLEDAHHDVSNYSQCSSEENTRTSTVTKQKNANNLTLDNIWDNIDSKQRSVFDYWDREDGLQEDSEGDLSTIRTEHSVVTSIPNPDDVMMRDIYYSCGAKMISDALQWSSFFGDPPHHACLEAHNEDDCESIDNENDAENGSSAGSLEN